MPSLAKNDINSSKSRYYLLLIVEYRLSISSFVIKAVYGRHYILLPTHHILCEADEAASVCGKGNPDFQSRT